MLVLFPTLAEALPQKIGDLDGDGVATVLDLAILNNYINGATPMPARIDPLWQFLDVNQDGFINSDDSTALIQRILGVQSLASLPLSMVRSTSPFAGEGNVAVTRQIIVNFTIPLSPDATITTRNADGTQLGHFYATAAGQLLLTRAELSSDRTKATLFFLEPVPASTRVTVVFDAAPTGATPLTDLLGRMIDPDGNGAAGGVFMFTYDTASITPVTGTGIIGHVYASERATGATADTPLAGVLIRVEGSENLFTYTAADGSFSLNPCPVGRFFVEIDGRPVTGQFPIGAYYPYIVKAWTAQPGIANNLAAGTGTIYLPLVPANTLQSVSATAMTTVTFAPSVVAANPAMAGVEIYVPPNDLFADDGTRGGMVGIAPVASDRLPEPLPPGLTHAIDISIQTDGATNFDTPVPVRFPNLPDPVTGIKLAPGAKSALWSYNHDKGTWEVIGPMTVTADGNYVTTDPGVGVRKPGWHGTMPGTSAEGPPPPKPCPELNAWDGLNTLLRAASAVAKCAKFVVKGQLKYVKLLQAVDDFTKLYFEIRAINKAFETGGQDLASLRATVFAIREVAAGLRKTLEINNPLSTFRQGLECIEAELRILDAICANALSAPECSSDLLKEICQLRNDALFQIFYLKNLIKQIEDRLFSTQLAQVETGADVLLRQIDALIAQQQKLMSQRAGADDAPVTIADVQASLGNLLGTMSAFDGSDPSQPSAPAYDKSYDQLSSIASDMGDIGARANGIPSNAYFVCEYADQSLRGKSSQTGQLQFILPPSTAFNITSYDPATNTTGFYFGKSEANGVVTHLHAAIADLSGDFQDSDGDGLSDEIEYVIGTDPSIPTPMVMGFRTARKPRRAPIRSAVWQCRQGY